MIGATPTAEMINDRKKDYSGGKPLVSVVVPAYNEAGILKGNLIKLYEYMKSLQKDYRWEIIVVNDGSTDGTGDIADAFAKDRSNVHVVHHVTNFRLGQALRTGFNHCKGDYVVTMDLDLSYSPDHIERMLSTIRQTGAQIVMASPYMPGGKTSNVPLLRRLLSKWANRFLSAAAHHGNFSTLTGMVRAYDAKFLKSLNLKAMDVDINPEIIYKGMILRARILEIPAHLDWGDQKKKGKKRTSSIRILKTIVSCLLSGFIFRPFMFFILPGFALFLLCLYPLIWAMIHTFTYYEKLSFSHPTLSFGHHLSGAVAEAFKLSPHSFLISGFTLMLALQLISLGVLALQNKRYFDELFHLGTTIYRINMENGKNS
jgi:glycosyltransferase involved in cell wall biosynthesis